ncbi:MAG: hypothetical protein MUE85_21505 [Microscillaceae bacterium]|jgi:hypothetical protein|nr:hypothetical protein [Microscillaceae bacterium]
MPLIDSLLAKIDAPDLLDILVHRLSMSELNSLFLEVYRQKTQQISPPQLLQNYMQNRFVAPSPLSPLDLGQFEAKALQLADLQDFTPIELSPLSPLGACSVVASADQNKVVSALRGTEVTADATNLLALECAKVRKSQGYPSQSLHYATVHRHVRSQVFNFKGFSSHFKILGLVSAGRDTGSFEFEKQSMARHLTFYHTYFSQILGIDSVKIHLKFLNTDTEVNRLANSVDEFLREKIPNILIETSQNPQVGQNYYQQLQFKFVLEWQGQVYEIADGGLVDWTQKLTQNRKERFLISGLGIELLFKLIHQLL